MSLVAPAREHSKRHARTGQGGGRRSEHDDEAAAAPPRRALRQRPASAKLGCRVAHGGRANTTGCCCRGRLRRRLIGWHLRVQRLDPRASAVRLVRRRDGYLRVQRVADPRDLAVRLVSRGGLHVCRGGRLRGGRRCRLCDRGRLVLRRVVVVLDGGVGVCGWLRAPLAGRARLDGRRRRSGRRGRLRRGTAGVCSCRLGAAGGQCEGSFNPSELVSEVHVGLVFTLRTEWEGGPRVSWCCARARVESQGGWRALSPLVGSRPFSLMKDALHAVIFRLSAAR